MTPDDIAKDRTSITDLRGDLGMAPFVVRNRLKNALDRWSAALDAVEKLQGAGPDTSEKIL